MIATVQEVAKHAGVSPKTVRRLADLGWIESRRNYTGWRVFPHPEQAAETIRRLLLGLDSKNGKGATTTTSE